MRKMAEGGNIADRAYYTGQHCPHIATGTEFRQEQEKNNADLCIHAPSWLVYWSVNLFIRKPALAPCPIHSHDSVL
jgi:hypothetical protein